MPGIGRRHSRGDAAVRKVNAGAARRLLLLFGAMETAAGKRLLLLTAVETAAGERLLLLAAEAEDRIGEMGVLSSGHDSSLLSAIDHFDFLPYDAGKTVIPAHHLLDSLSDETGRQGRRSIAPEPRQGASKLSALIITNSSSLARQGENTLRR